MVFVCVMKSLVYICELKRRLSITLTINIHIMNKTELVAKIAETAGLSKADAKKALDATVDVVNGVRIDD